MFTLFFVLFYTGSGSVHSLTFRSLCVSFLLHLFICAICESLYKQLVHSLHFLTDDTDKQNKQISSVRTFTSNLFTRLYFLTDDTDEQNKQTFFANRTQRPNGRRTHRVVGQVDSYTLESRQAAGLCIR